MAIVVPAITGQMGSTQYYETSMKARELVSSVRPASERDEWATIGIEERMQRDLNMKRVVEEIAPYLSKSADRFTGAVIVLVRDPEVFTFERVQDLGAKIPAAYRGVAERLGFLTLEGGELIYLDGQHRGAAFRTVIQSPKGDGQVSYSADVPNDDVCVIFIRYESGEKTRRIFNKVNRYARTTSRADNIITSEDDGYAIVTRWLLEEGAPLGLRDGSDLIVNWRTNTITERSTKLTTLSAVYETVKVILSHEGVRNFDEKTRVVRPSDEELHEAFESAEQWWEVVLDGITAYKTALRDTSLIPEMRRDTERTSLLFKPAGLIALFMGIIKAVQRGLDRDDAIRRANSVDWRTVAPMWRGTIVRESGKMSARAEDYELASELIAYLVGADVMEEEDIAALQTSYSRARNPKLNFLGRSVTEDDLEPLPAHVALAEV